MLANKTPRMARRTAVNTADAFSFRKDDFIRRGARAVARIADDRVCVYPAVRPCVIRLNLRVEHRRRADLCRGNFAVDIQLQFRVRAEGVPRAIDEPNDRPG